jgi:hypothetical protein
LAKGSSLTKHTGGCHCGRVRFEVDAPEKIDAIECNCSICNQCGYLHLLVSRDNFRLVQGEDAITTYTFNSNIAKHHFCKFCGVKSFYVPRSHPDGLSINVRCLDEGTAEVVKITPFDGQNWEQKVSELSPLSG